MGGAEGAWQDIDGVGHGADRIRARCIQRLYFVSPSRSNSYCPQFWTAPNESVETSRWSTVLRDKRVVMIREDEEVLLALSRIGRDSDAFALGVLGNSISRDGQIALAIDSLAWLKLFGSERYDSWTRYRRQRQ